MVAGLFDNEKRINIMAYVASKLTADVNFTTWKKRDKSKPSNLNLRETKILIKGGAGVANKKTFVTKLGSVTEVSDENIELLKKSCPAFNRHIERGNISIMKSKVEMEKAVKDMNPEKDKSAPLTKKDLEAKSEKDTKVKTNAAGDK